MLNRLELTLQHCYFRFLNYPSEMGFVGVIQQFFHVALAWRRRWKKKFAKTRKLWMNSKRGSQPFCGGGVTTRHGEGCGRVARDGCVSWRGINFANAAGSRWKMQMKRRCFVLFYLVFGWPRFIITAFKSSLDKVFKYIFF